MTQDQYAEATCLFETERYEECLSYLELNLWKNTAPKLQDFLLRAKCCMELGRWKQAWNFPWALMDFKMPGNMEIEALTLLEENYKKRGVPMQERRYHNRRTYIEGRFNLPTANQEEQEEWKNVCDEQGNLLPERLLSYCCRLFSTEDFVRTAFFHALYLKLTQDKETPDSALIWSILNREANIGLIYEQLFDETTDSVAFTVDTEQDYLRYFSMARMCCFFGKKAYLIAPPIEWEVEGELPSKEQSLRCSYDALQMMDGVFVTSSIRYLQKGSCREETLLLLLDDLSKQTKGKQLLLFAECNVFKTMKSPHVKRSVLHYLAANQEVLGMPYQTTFGYVNGYENMMSSIYGCNIIAELKKPSKYAYSIVLPVRNNINTLGYTLRTCLELNHSDYEILVSDNSDEENTQIRELLHKEFDSEKIRYIRTPRVLPIAKSFEYAYIKAEGDFLVPIGSDDGILSHALGMLDAVRGELEKREPIPFLSWDRVHYVWNGMTTTGQEGELVLQRCYQPREISLERRKSIELLQLLFQEPKTVYGMPTLYLNSGMKRDYLYTILQKTGAVSDGHSQDLYMALVNLALNEYFYHIKQPITIAALSSASSGARSYVGETSQENFEQMVKEYYSSNALHPLPRDTEKLLRMSQGDVANTLTMVLRLIDMECLSEEWLKKINWEVYGRSICEQMQYKDILREQVERHMLHSVSLFSPDAEQRLRKQLQKQEIRPNRYDLVQGKQYVKGFQKDGSLHLDASEFGVQDVYGACHLVENICHLSF